MKQLSHLPFSEPFLRSILCYLSYLPFFDDQRSRFPYPRDPLVTQTPSSFLPIRPSLRPSPPLPPKTLSKHSCRPLSFSPAPGTKTLEKVIAVPTRPHLYSFSRTRSLNPQWARRRSAFITYSPPAHKVLRSVPIPLSYDSRYSPYKVCEIAAFPFALWAPFLSIQCPQ